MKRTQIQIPDPLYTEVKRLARLKDWSISEVFRRAVEQMILENPSIPTAETWTLPAPKPMGKEIILPSQWRAVVADDEGRL